MFYCKILVFREHQMNSWHCKISFTKKMKAKKNTSTNAPHMGKFINFLAYNNNISFKKSLDKGNISFKILLNQKNRKQLLNSNNSILLVKKICWQDRENFFKHLSGFFLCHIHLQNKKKNKKKPVII